MPSTYLEGQPLRLEDGPQLLLDDHLVEDRFGLERVLQQPEKHLHNPIPVRDKAWAGPPQIPHEVLQRFARNLRPIRCERLQRHERPFERNLQDSPTETPINASRCERQRGIRLVGLLAEHH